MDARTRNLKSVFGQDRRHIVPLYQRPYVWKRAEQWEPLWDDVQEVAERILEARSDRPHFLGAIVLEQMRTATGQVESRLVIDGQQRLTTLQILLEACCDYCLQAGAEKHHKAFLKLTRNDDPMSEDGDDCYKVWPTNADQEHFRRVMTAGSPSELYQTYGSKPGSSCGHNIADAYIYFFDAVQTWVGASNEADVRLDGLIHALREKISLVVIDLEPDDDAQMIFETLNARGTPLLPSDLVKNALLHQAQREKENVNVLYEKHWKVFDADAKYWRELVGRGRTSRARLDLFLQHYLTLSTRDDISVGHLYAAFQKYAKESKLTAKEHLERLRSFAELFRSFDQFQKDSAEGRFFSWLDAMEVTTAYPFVMQVFAMKAEPTARRQVLRDIESFLVRRMVCQLNTRGYNRLFIELLKHLDGPVQDAPSRIRAFLLSSQADSSRWPDDEEFGRKWKSTPLYSVLLQKRVRVLLETIELELYSKLTEKVEIKERLTIEHVMPQKWREHWPLVTEEDTEQRSRHRDTVVHSIGNLTLVNGSLNPTLSNDAWKTKRESMRQFSALALNRQLLEFQDWGEAEIASRADALLEVAKRVWSRPDAARANPIAST